jgi:hypothetical protein
VKLYNSTNPFGSISEQQYEYRGGVLPLLIHSEACCYGNQHSFRVGQGRDQLYLECTPRTSVVVWWSSRMLLILGSCHLGRIWCFFINAIKVLSPLPAFLYIRKTKACWDAILSTSYGTDCHMAGRGTYITHFHCRECMYSVKVWFNVYKIGSVMGLSVEVIPTDGDRLFRRFRPFLAFQIFQTNVHLCINAREDCQVSVHGEKLYNGNVEFMTVSEINGELSVFIMYLTARSLNHWLLHLVKLRLK